MKSIPGANAGPVCCFCSAASLLLALSLIPILGAVDGAVERPGFDPVDATAGPGVDEAEFVIAL
jgi:hypothetical protein